MWLHIFLLALVMRGILRKLYFKIEKSNSAREFIVAVLLMSPNQTSNVKRLKRQKYQ